MRGGFRLGIDVGGTFTDAVLLSEADGHMHIAKVPSTPADPSQGFVHALIRVLEKAGVSAEEVSVLVHGTTVATNALIEGKTARTAFVATEGFGDMLEIARQVRPSLYDIHFRKPRPLIPRDLCFEVPERLDATGAVVRELDEDAVRAIGVRLEQLGVGSVAVCLLHSYLNPSHEERVARILRESNPELNVSLSSHILPEFREYFRASTTVVNACLRPLVSSYLCGIERDLRQRNIAAELLVMQSNGGVLTFEGASAKPVYMVESGPAAGVIAAVYVGAAIGRRDLLSLDMGGTTTKAGLILDGQPRVTKEYEVGAEALPGTGQSRGSGYPIRTPVIELVEIGAGGGSIAWVDSGGVLRVGPRSAGAEPGPICYRRGGERPTITDANVLLGRVNPRFLLGGEMELDAAASLDGIRRHCAEPLHMDPVAAAHGIIEIANAAMMNALRLISVRRGFDPREFTMVAFGGAAPLHANRLAAELQVPLVVIPPSPGTTSALGLLVTDLKHQFTRTRVTKAEFDPAAVRAIFEPLEREGTETLVREGVAGADLRLQREIEVRYTGQSHELAVPCGSGALTADDLREVVRGFHAEHQRTYGHAYPSEPVEAVSFRVTALGVIAKPSPRRWPSRAGSVETAQLDNRPVFFQEAGGFTATAIFDRYRLAPGDLITGPAVIEEMDSTSLIHPGYQAEVDTFGNLLLRPYS